MARTKFCFLNLFQIDFTGCWNILGNLHSVFRLQSGHFSGLSNIFMAITRERYETRSKHNLTITCTCQISYMTFYLKLAPLETK